MLTETEKTAILATIRGLAENARGAHLDDPAGWPLLTWEAQIASQCAQIRGEIRVRGIHGTANWCHLPEIVEFCDYAAVMLFVTLVGDTPAMLPDTGSNG